MENTANTSAETTTTTAETQVADAPQQIDISNVEVPLTLTVAEINFVLGSLGQQPFNQVAGFISKVKTQAEGFLATLQQPAA